MLTMALVVALGGIVANLAGWSVSKEKFDLRKFISNTWVVLGSAVAVALLTSDTETLTVRDYLLAFVSSSGLNVLAVRAKGIVRK